MRWTRSWALAAAAALGCSRGSAPGPELKEPDPLSAPGLDLHRPSPSAPDPPAASAPAPTPSPRPSAPPAPPSFLLTELAPTQGNLTPLLVAQVERGRAKHLRTVVELYADWCAPCRVFQDNLQDPRMKEALQGVYLVKLNLDDWHDKLPGTGFEVRSIPAFFLVGADGRPSGKMLDGDKWGRATVPIMSASLSKFLAQ